MDQITQKRERAGERESQASQRGGGERQTESFLFEFSLLLLEFSFYFYNFDGLLLNNLSLIFERVNYISVPIESYNYFTLIYIV